MTDLTVHVTKRAIAYLLGKLTGVLEATLPFGELACGGINPYVAANGVLDWQRAIEEWVNLVSIDAWKAGKPIRLPTCPRCAVLWDDAITQCAQPQIETKS